MKIGELIATLGMDMTDFQNKMKEVDKSLVEQGKKMEKFGKKMTMAVSLPLMGVGAAAFKLNKDFDYNLSKIVGLVGVAKEEVAAWRGEILKLADATGIAPKELADAMYFITSAGIRGAAAMETLVASSQAAAAGLGDTAVVADLVTSAINAYGSATLSATKAVDILVATVREGKAAAPDIAGAMGQVLPIASELGVSFDQVGASVAVMTRTGTNAAVSVTQLRGILSSLLKPTKQAEEALNSMGTSSKQLRELIETDGLIGVIQKLRDLQLEYGDDVLGQVIPNVRALSGVLNIAGANFEQNKKIFETMAQSGGDLAAAYQNVEDTAEHAWKKSLASSQSAMIKIGDTVKLIFLPVINSMSAALTGLGNIFEKFPDWAKVLVAALGGILVAMGPVIMTVGLFIQRWGLFAGGVIKARVQLLLFAKTLKGMTWTGLWTSMVAGWGKVTAAVRAAFVQTSVLGNASLWSKIGSSIGGAFTLIAAKVKAFSMALISNPIGATLLALTAVAGVLMLYKRRTEAATLSQQNMGEVMKKVNEVIDEQAVAWAYLSTLLGNNSTGKAREQVIDKLNEKLTELNLTTLEYSATQDQVNKTLQDAEKVAKAKAYADEWQAKIQENLTTIAQNNAKILENENKLKTAGVGTSERAMAAMTNEITLFKKQNKELTGLNTVYADVSNVINNIISQGLTPDLERQLSTYEMMFPAMKQYTQILREISNIKVEQSGGLTQTETDAIIAQKRYDELKELADKEHELESAELYAKRDILQKRFNDLSSANADEVEAKIDYYKQILAINTEIRNAEQKHRDDLKKIRTDLIESIDTITEARKKYGKKEYETMQMDFENKMKLIKTNRDNELKQYKQGTHQYETILKEWQDIENRMLEEHTFAKAAYWSKERDTYSKHLTEMTNSRTQAGLNEIELVDYMQTKHLQTLEELKQAELANYAENQEKQFEILQYYQGLEDATRAEYAAQRKVLEKKTAEEVAEYWQDAFKEIKQSLKTQEQTLKDSYKRDLALVYSYMMKRVIAYADGMQVIVALTAKYDAEMAELKEIRNMGDEMAAAVNSSVETMLVTFGEAMATVEGRANFANSILTVLADLAIAVGKIAIGVGVSVLKIRTALMAALKTPAGAIAAIIAGAALVAIGNAAKGNLASLGGGGGGGGSVAPQTSQGQYQGGSGKGLATGGEVTKSGKFTIGEKGEELALIPNGNASTSVIDNLKAMLIGGNGEQEMALPKGAVVIPNNLMDNVVRSMRDTLPDLDISKLQGLANGGTVIKSGAFKVGERGVETVHLPKGAAVTPFQNKDNEFTLSTKISGRDLEIILERAQAQSKRR